MEINLLSFFGFFIVDTHYFFRNLNWNSKTPMTKATKEREDKSSFKSSYLIFGNQSSIEVIYGQWSVEVVVNGLIFNETKQYTRNHNWAETKIIFVVLLVTRNT